MVGSTVISVNDIYFAFILKDQISKLINNGAFTKMYLISPFLYSNPTHFNAKPAAADFLKNSKIIYFRPINKQHKYLKFYYKMLLFLIYLFY